MRWGREGRAARRARRRALRRISGDAALDTLDTLDDGADEGLPPASGRIVQRVAGASAWELVPAPDDDEWEREAFFFA